MWQALGNCFENLDRPEEAIKAYKRALVGSAMDPAVLLRLAELLEKDDDLSSAAKYFRLCLKEEEVEGMTEATIRSRIWLARYEFFQDNLPEARDHCNELTQNGHDNEEVKALLKDIRLRLENAA